MAAERQESEARPETSPARTDGGDSGSTALGQQATETIEKFRTVIDQASQSLRELVQASGQWVQSSDRAREMAQGLRTQGEQYVGTVSRQVEQNPMMSIAIAFAMGYLLATMTRR